jgi:hypothetical protein
MDDEWFHVYRDGVLWKAYLFGDDQRAGSVQAASNGQISYSGQLAQFMAGITMMRAAEPMLSIYPAPPQAKRSQG